MRKIIYTIIALTVAVSTAHAEWVTRTYVDHRMVEQHHHHPVRCFHERGHRLVCER